jgi:signal transduction histidine kinase
MSWTNFALLAIGFAAGLITNWRRQSPSTPPPIAPSPHRPIAPSTLDQTHLAYLLATEMSQFKGGFLARTAHELRSPLNGLIGAHQLILSDLCESPAEEREFIQQAHDSALKMVAMLDDILTVAKVDHGKLAVDLQPLPLAPIFQEVEKLTHLLAEDRNVKLQVQVPDPDIYVLSDARWLRQVLVNLISTAIGQMPAGQITLMLQPDPHPAQIWLETTSPLDFWSEPVQLLQSVSPELAQQELLRPQLKHMSAQPSTGFTLLLTQTLLEALQGRLEVLVLPSDDSELTRIQCTIPPGAKG